MLAQVEELAQQEVRRQANASEGRCFASWMLYKGTKNIPDCQIFLELFSILPQRNLHFFLPFYLP